MTPSERGEITGSSTSWSGSFDWVMVSSRFTYFRMSQGQFDNDVRHISDGSFAGVWS